MDSNRRRSKNRTDNCNFCGKQYKHYSYDKQLFCSRTCNSMSKRIKTNCEVCNTEVLKVKSLISRNENNYCSRKCYEKRRKEDLKKIKRHTNYFLELVEKGCSCGIKEYYLLQVHHIDGDTNNNNPSNHEVVCANCHIKRHLKLNKKGKLVYHTKTLTDTNIIKV